MRKFYITSIAPKEHMAVSFYLTIKGVKAAKAKLEQLNRNFPNSYNSMIEI